MKIAVIGTGFGLPVGDALCADSGSEVTLFSRSHEFVDRCQSTRRFPQQSVGAGAMIPDNMRVERMGGFEESYFDIVILAVPVSAMTVLCGNGTFTVGGRTPLVLVQKGLLPGCLTPYEFVRSLMPERPLLYFVGAAFASDIMAGAPVAMMLASEPASRGVGTCFLQVLSRTKRFMPFESQEPFSLARIYGLRGIGSLIQGIGAGYLALRYGSAYQSTFATFEAGVTSELYRVVTDALNVDRSLFQQAKPEGRIFSADTRLCVSQSSRNCKVGYLVGSGQKTLAQAIQESEGVAESVTSAQHLLEYLGSDRLKNYPFLSGLQDFFNGMPIQDCAEELLLRQFARHL